MAKATKTAAKKTADNQEQKAERKAANAEEMTTVLEAPKPDPDRAPREDDTGRRERRGPKKDINAEDEGQDKVYGVASRARWGGTETIHELSQDAQEAEQSANENRE